MPAQYHILVPKSHSRSESASHIAAGMGNHLNKWKQRDVIPALIDLPTHRMNPIANPTSRAEF